MKWWYCLHCVRPIEVRDLSLDAVYACAHCGKGFIYSSAARELYGESDPRVALIKQSLIEKSAELDDPFELAKSLLPDWTVTLEDGRIRADCVPHSCFSTYPSTEEHIRAFCEYAEDYRRRYPLLHDDRKELEKPQASPEPVEVIKPVAITCAECRAPLRADQALQYYGDKWCAYCYHNRRDIYAGRGQASSKAAKPQIETYRHPSDWSCVATPSWEEL